MTREPTSPQTPERAPRVLRTVGWMIVAIMVSTVIPYAGVAVALIGAGVIRARWKLFVGLAVALLAFTLAYYPIGVSSVETRGLS